MRIHIMHATRSFVNLIITLVTIQDCYCDVIQLTSSNIDGLLQQNKVVFVNFYADWCRFSRMLAPIFVEASNLVANEFAESSDVAFAKLDCDAEPTLAQRYSVNKYPTMKLFRNGQMMKKEYRGQRTASSLADFVKEQLRNPVKEFSNLDEIYELSRDKRTVIGYFESKESPQYTNFETIAKILKDDCRFYAGFGDVSKPERTTGDNVIFRPDGDTKPEMVYLGSLANKDLFQAWTQDKCVPLVREITFANGEELTEEGLPFLILFHLKEDTESYEAYTKEVSRLITFKSSINFLVADCETFSHPLHHLGKTVKDCPLVAIDSFRHMYMFPDFSKINEPDTLKQFILDLQSGKLHREFHHGPDTPTQPPAAATQKQLPSKSPSGYHNSMPESKLRSTNNNPGQMVDKRSVENAEGGAESNVGEKRAEEEETKHETKETAPTTIKSVFVNMQPSEHRYTILKKVNDEL